MRSAKGVGWVKEQDELVYDLENKHVLTNTFPLAEQDEALMQAKAYLQSVVDFYLKAGPGDSSQLTGH